MLSPMANSGTPGYRARSSRSIAAASSASARDPGQNPRPGAAPNPRWSGANTAIPAAAKAGAGISQASRLSLNPCSASTTAVGAPGGSHRRTGSPAPSGIVNTSSARSVAAGSGGSVTP